MRMTPLTTYTGTTQTTSFETATNTNSQSAGELSPTTTRIESLRLLELAQAEDQKSLEKSLQERAKSACNMQGASKVAKHKPFKNLDLQTASTNFSKELREDLRRELIDKDEEFIRESELAAEQGAKIADFTLARKIATNTENDLLKDLALREVSKYMSREVHFGRQPDCVDLITHDFMRDQVLKNTSHGLVGLEEFDLAAEKVNSILDESLRNEALVFLLEAIKPFLNQITDIEDFIAENPNLYASYQIFINEGTVEQINEMISDVSNELVQKKMIQDLRIRETVRNKILEKLFDVTDLDAFLGKNPDLYASYQKFLKEGDLFLVVDKIEAMPNESVQKLVVRDLLIERAEEMKSIFSPDEFEELMLD